MSVTSDCERVGAGHQSETMTSFMLNIANYEPDPASS